MTRLRASRIHASIVALILIVAGGPAVAQSADDGTARRVVETIVDRAIAILERPLGREREAAFLALFRAEFATAAIGRFVLGAYRSNASPPQFERYMATLETLVAKTTAARLSRYSGEPISIGTARADGRRWIVTSRISPRDREPIRLDWVLAPAGDRLKVVDLRVENLSLALTQRDEFASVLQSSGGDIDRLIAFMNDKIRALDAGVEPEPIVPARPG